MDFENEINIIFNYLNVNKIRELAQSTNSQCLWFYPVKILKVLDKINK